MSMPFAYATHSSFLGSITGGGFKPKKVTRQDRRDCFLAQLWCQGRKFSMVTFGVADLDAEVERTFGPWVGAEENLETVKLATCGLA